MTIVFASNNPGKFREVNSFLSKRGFLMHLQSDYSVGEVLETGSTFIENAVIKARHASRHTHLPAIGDDSGLIVDALNQAPGIYSARYAGIGSTAEENIQKLLNALQDVPDAKRTARFYCVMVYLRSAEDPIPLIAEGTWEGIITQEPHGQQGFGYDPIFFIPKQGRTAAELKPTLKNKLSHRGQALSKLVRFIKK